MLPLERLGIDLTVMLDRDGTAGRDRGVFAYPTTVVLDTEEKSAWIVRGAIDRESPAVIATITSILPSPDARPASGGAIGSAVLSRAAG